MSNNSEKAKKPEIRCLKSKAFFDLMKIEKPDDCGHSIKEQIAIEDLVKSTYLDFMSNKVDDPELPQLNRENHIKFLLKGLGNLPSSFEMLDASHPWICYWILHSLYLVDAKLSDEMTDSIVRFLHGCQCQKTSAFGGGPDQIAHLAPTYAGVNALCTLNSTRALKILDQEKLAKWIRSLKMSDGAMKMHEDGEEDLRGAYCAISVAKLCNLESIDPHLFDGVAEWIASCQTYEGGFGATPFNEAHGGYSYCGLAALKLLGKEHLCDIDRLTRWLVNKQMSFEGGFQGRTNKLVDSCYSFWQAGMFPIIQTILAKDNDYLQESDNWLFDRASLQEYILICCQNNHGGIIDKPGKSRDYYHTCYALSGLSISQYYSDNILNICSSDDSLLNKTHPLFNICFEGAFKSINYFSTKKDDGDLDDIEK